ncbi:MAG: RibD family protein, partial [Caulobacterales bacterium]|nr:RibD family protein [Caulobacterales bacterium]
MTGPAAKPRPQVTVKLATSLDGRIAAPSGESKWITGEAARAEGHRLRAAHHAVLIGSQTAIDDDPLLTVRVDDYEGPQPMRVVADARMRLPRDSRLVASALPLSQATETGDAEHAVTAVITALKPNDEQVWELNRRNVLIGFADAGSGGGVHPRALLEETAGFLENPLQRINTVSEGRILGELQGRLSFPHVCVGSPFAFRRHGESARYMSELYPHLAQHVDQMAFVHGIKTD